MIPRWIVTPSHDSTINSDPGSGSRFKVEFWPGVTIRRGILTRGRALFNVDPSTIYNSSTRGSATQEGVKIQPRTQNSTAKEGQNSTKKPLKIVPGLVFNGEGAKFYLAPAMLYFCGTEFSIGVSCLSLDTDLTNAIFGYYCGHQRQWSINRLYFKRQNGNSQALRSQAFWPWCYKVKRFYWSNVHSKYLFVLVSLMAKKLGG